MPSTLCRGVVAIAAVVIAPMTARAADLPVIRVFPPECATPPVSIDDFVDALRVEQAGRQPHCCVVGPGGDGAADAVRVTLVIEPCEPSTEQVDVSVDVTGTQRTITRQVGLADLPPEARPRALALAVAEMLRSIEEPAPPPVAPPPPPPPQAPAATGPPLLLTGAVAGEVRIHVSNDTTLWGARLGLTLSGGPWQLTLDAGAAAGRSQVNLGELNILLASATLFAGPRFVLGPMIASVGPAGTLGWARIEGQTDMPSVFTRTGSGIVGTAGLRAAAEAPASRTLRLLAYFEAGLTVRRFDARVDGQPAAGIAGTYLLVAAGIRFGPS